MHSLSLETKPKWRQVTVVGCGLIGSSFALALKRRELCARILGWDSSSAALQEAIASGVIEDVDYCFSSSSPFESDLIYLAMPVLQIIKFLSEKAAQISNGTIVTDAGSTKSAICRSAREYLSGECDFLGGHPIAGSHLSGSRHATAELFEGASYVLINDGASSPPAFERVRETIEALGARVVIMSPAEHDRVLALVSHLPQLISNVLARTVADQQDGNRLAAVAGAGFKDMTRLSESSWTIWRDVLATNPAQIAAALDLFIERFSAVRDELINVQEAGDVELLTLQRLFQRH